MNLRNRSVKIEVGILEYQIMYVVAADDRMQARDSSGKDALWDSGSR